MLINKKTLEYLAELARIEMEAPTPKEGRGPDRSVGKKLLKDLQKILAYFEELKEVDTENIEPMAGGTIEKNVFREDELVEADRRGKKNLEADLRGKLTDQFPEEEKVFLKVPPVFK